MISKRKRLLGFIFIIAILGVLVWLVVIWHRAMYAPLLINDKAQSIKVYPGSTIHDLAKTLDARKLLTHPHIFIFVARISGRSNKLRFGEYKILPGMNATTLLAHVVTGRGLVKYQITFVEGWTFGDIVTLLQENPHLFHRLKHQTPAEIMASIGQPGQHPEGLFMPDTYTFVWGNTDINILKHAYKRMQLYLAEQWRGRAPGLPYKDAYQALIVASLIEKETSLDQERPIIASVILNRLKKGMRLQVDPTVLYGLNKAYGTQITRQDLKIATSYNTYRIPGLPPTPIDIPSRISIYAALHPANESYLYYVARGDGSHIFSETYQQHLKAVKKYRAWLLQQQLEDKP